MAQKLLFIDSSVPEREILIENISDNVKIVSDSNSLKDIELDNISNIGFVWKNYWIGTVKPHFPDFNYPIERQISNDNELVLERKTIKEIAGNFPELKNIDLITCNLNEDSEWKDAFDELKDGLSENINVRYSINRTGSATLQGDWILESHDVNILDEYFANKDFVYNHHLAQSGFQEINDEFLMNYPEFSISIIGNTLNLNGDINNIEGNTWKTIIIKEEVTIGGESVKIDCIDGNGYTITFDNATLPIESIFFNNTGNELVIKNLIVDGDASNSFKGIVYSELECRAQQVVVKNCGVKNLQTALEYGAIFGPYAGYGQNNYVKAIACYSTGDINSGGGIYGEQAGGVGGSAYAIACYSTGNINSGGGIYGSFAGINGGKTYAIACYSTGDIIGGGGIYGVQAGSVSGTAYAIACYSTGNINGAGGIYGSLAGITMGSAYAIACYSTGDIIGGGGIYGVQAGRSIGSAAYAIACYSTGNINSGGGIYGSFAGIIGGKTYAIACYSTGDITTTGGNNNGSGGIYGSFAENFGIASAIACYSTGQKDDIDMVSGYIFATTNSNILAEETFARTDIGWRKYVSGSGNGEMYDPFTLPITPDKDLFYYDNAIMPEENQLELRFFRSLPWDPRSPIPQRPFLLDWSTCDFEKVFYDKWLQTDNAWFINNNFDGIEANIESARQLLTNLKSCNPPNENDDDDDYNPNEYVDCIKLEPINFCNIKLYDMIYIVKDDVIVRVESLAGCKINGTYTYKDVIYRVNTQFPIYSEFSSVANANANAFIDQQKCNPFLLNFSCVAEYPFAFANWSDYNDYKNRFNPNFYCCNLKIIPFIHNIKLTYQLKDCKNNNIGDPITTDNNCAIFKNVNLCQEYSVCITDTGKNKIELNEKYIPSKYMYWECC
jgi:hypothetical protein